MCWQPAAGVRSSHCKAAGCRSSQFSALRAKASQRPARWRIVLDILRTGRSALMLPRWQKTPPVQHQGFVVCVALVLQHVAEARAPLQGKASARFAGASHCTPSNAACLQSGALRVAGRDGLSSLRIAAHSHPIRHLRGSFPAPRMHRFCRYFTFSAVCVAPLQRPIFTHSLFRKCPQESIFRTFFFTKVQTHSGHTIFLVVSACFYKKLLFEFAAQ